MFGFGAQKTPESFRQACRRFIYTENLLPEAPAADARAGAKPLQPLGHATRILTRVIAEMESDDGWVPLSRVGSQLANLASDFDPRSYGFRKLSDLARRIDALELDQTEAGHPRIRPRPVAARKPGSSAKPKKGT